MYKELAEVLGELCESCGLAGEHGTEVFLSREEGHQGVVFVTKPGEKDQMVVDMTDDSIVRHDASDEGETTRQNCARRLADVTRERFPNDFQARVSNDVWVVASIGERVRVPKRR